MRPGLDLFHRERLQAGEIRGRHQLASLLETLGIKTIANQNDSGNRHDVSLFLSIYFPRGETHGIHEKPVEAGRAGELEILA